MNKTRNNLTDIQPYIAEAIRGRHPLTVSTPGLGFAYAVNKILAKALELDAPKSARDLMSERQKLRWQSEREKKDEIERKAAAKNERRKEARKVKKAEAEHGEK